MCKIDEVLQIDVVAVRLDVIVDEEVELVFDPVLEDQGQDPGRQLQEEYQSQEHRELDGHTHTHPPTHATETLSFTFCLCA